LDEFRSVRIQKSPNFETMNYSSLFQNFRKNKN
jgi:hypothetical protein